MRIYLVVWFYERVGKYSTDKKDISLPLFLKAFREKLLVLENVIGLLNTTSVILTGEVLEGS